MLTILALLIIGAVLLFLSRVPQVVTPGPRRGLCSLFELDNFHAASTVNARPRRSRPQRYRLGSQRGPASAGNTFRNAAITAVAAGGGNDVVVTLDQPVSLKGLPNWTFNVGGPITAASLTAPNEVTVTTTSDPAAAVSLTVGENDPAVRTTTGGWVNAGVTTIALD